MTVAKIKGAKRANIGSSVRLALGVIGGMIAAPLLIDNEQVDKVAHPVGQALVLVGVPEVVGEKVVAGVIIGAALGWSFYKNFRQAQQAEAKTEE